MNRKGFTLTEIIGAIIILGILVIIAVITFTGSMKGFREDYYTESERTLTESGKEFFNDNRKYRPSEVLGAQIVPLNTLVAQHYIDEVTDYNGDSCSNSSYVIVIKNGKDDYTYHTCLVCPGDEYSNMNDKYCDSAWTNSSTVEYSIATPPNLYRYKGIPKSALKEELGIKASYVKKNSKGEVIGVVDGTGFDDAPVIYPDDVDKVDPNKLGKYELTYTYQEQKVTGHVTIYEYKSPTTTIIKENEVAKNLAGNTEIQKTTYESGQWAQKIYITLTKGSPNAGENVSIGDLKNTVHKFQWNKDGIWQDLCPGDDCTGRAVTVEMNENISFRSIDVNGITSEETTPIAIRIDNTKPTCAIISNGQHKDNPDWYTSDVTVNFTKYDDLVGTSPEAKSGIKVKNITVSTGNLNRRTDITSLVHNQDTRGVTYIGYVEDEAENFIRCVVSFKRDVTNPVCSLITEGTMGNNNWYVSDSVKTSFNTNTDATSGVREYGIGSYTGSKTINNPNDTGGTTYTGYIKDIAGNTSTCNVSYKKDSTQPECVLKTTGTMGNNNWYKSLTVSVSFGSATDNLSGVNSYGLGGYSEPNTKIQSDNTTGVTYTGYIKDNAGNTNSCSVSFKKDDASNVNGCRVLYGNSTWKNIDSVTVGLEVINKPISGCTAGENSTDGWTTDCRYSSLEFINEGETIKVKQASGNVGFSSQSGVLFNCTNGPYNIYSDRKEPTCTVSYGGDSLDGVNVTVGCKDDGGSGCTTESYNLGAKKSSGTQKISDNAGNSNICNYNISSYPVYSTRSVATCTKTCCGTHNCNCQRCQNGCKSYNYSCTGGTPNCSHYGSERDCGLPTHGDCGWSRGSCKEYYYVDCNCQQCDNTCTNVDCCGYTDWGSWTTSYCSPSVTCKTSIKYHGG